MRRSSRRWAPDVPQAVVDSFDMLIEIMMGYGIAYREHESLVHRQQELEYEIEVAVGMQQTLLPETLPTFPGIDIGVISVPANRMSGDYYNVVDHGRGKDGGGASRTSSGKGISRRPVHVDDQVRDGRASRRVPCVPRRSSGASTASWSETWIPACLSRWFTAFTIPGITASFTRRRAMNRAWCSGRRNGNLRICPPVDWFSASLRTPPTRISTSWISLPETRSFSFPTV